MISKLLQRSQDLGVCYEAMTISGLLLNENIEYVQVTVPFRDTTVTEKCPEPTSIRIEGHTKEALQLTSA